MRVADSVRVPGQCDRCRLAGAVSIRMLQSIRMNISGGGVVGMDHVHACLDSFQACMGNTLWVQSALSCDDNTLVLYNNPWSTSNTAQR